MLKIGEAIQRWRREAGPRYQLLLISSAGLAAAVLAARFLFMPVFARIGAQRATLRDLTVKAEDAAGLIAQQPAHERALAQAEQRGRGLDSRVRGQSIARILDALGQQAREHHLELTVVQDAMPSEAAHLVRFGPDLVLREVPLRLQLQGRYRQVGEFLGALREAPFLAIVKQADIARPAEGTGSLKTELALAVYIAEQPS